MTAQKIIPRQLVAVNQIDREAYARIAIVSEQAQHDILNGDWDTWEGVQAFARHRILVEQITADTCAELAHGVTTLDAEFPYDRGRKHAFLAVREAFPMTEHDQFCVCARCVNLRGKYMTEVEDAIVTGKLSVQRCHPMS